MNPKSMCTSLPSLLTTWEPKIYVSVLVCQGLKQEYICAIHTRCTRSMQNTHTTMQKTELKKSPTTKAKHLSPILYEHPPVM
jgi:hypothetical protein